MRTLILKKAHTVKTSSTQNQRILCVAFLSLSLPSMAQNITELSFEQLLDTKVTSVAKTEQKQFDAAAAVFVISQEDIRRSGVTSIPEALRMVPGLQVARLNSNQWAITTRGFNSQFANKLLVLIDGRTVYTPIFSGTYWELLDMPLANIERIEVIRGPGASLWGANAVNGIINIITKEAKNTQGGLLSVAVGEEEKTVADFRYGGSLGENLFWRGYGKLARRDGLLDQNEQDAKDDWQLGSAGFRLDWRASPKDVVMLQADIHDAELKRNFTLPAAEGSILDEGELSNYSILARWEHTASLASRSALQIYYQREERDDLFSVYELDTIDLDFQHEFAISANQEFIWGLGYRYSQDDFDDAVILNTDPQERDYQLFSLFAQDRLSLFDQQMEITLGTKIEHNSFTGWEFQPSARLLWKPAAKQRLWASVSRAVRSPSRVEQDMTINSFLLPADGAPPSLIVVTGNDQFDSEQVMAYELGYRVWPNNDLFLDFAAFYNDYDDLRFGRLNLADAVLGSDVVTVPLLLENLEQAKTYGFEVAADWQPLDGWRLQLAYSYLRSDFSFKPGTDISTLAPSDLGNERTPRQQISLRSAYQLSATVELDVWLRYVDQIVDIQTLPPVPAPALDDYLSLDIRLGWRPADNLELSLHGRNLTDVPRSEFLPDSNGIPTQVERSFFGQIKWQF